MTTNEKRELIKQAMRYRSGADSCNSVYLGSLATAMLYDLVGVAYGEEGFDEALDEADDATLNRMTERCRRVIDYMQAHPTKARNVLRPATIQAE